MISSASEVVAYGVSGLIIKRFGLKLSFFVCFIISFIGGIFYIFFGYIDNLVPVLILGAKFGVASTFNSAYLANALLYPTTLVGTAFGICNMAARLATIVAPELAEVDAPIPMTVFTILAGVAAIATLMMIKPKDEKAK